MSGNLCVFLQEDGIGYYIRLEDALKANLGNELEICRNLEDIASGDDKILILVVENLEYDELSNIIKSLPQNMIKRSVIFGYPDENHKEILERCEPFGLATSGAVTGWLRSGARPSRMLGSRNGLYGRREFFDPAIFAKELIGFDDTERYMIFETIDPEELPVIIRLYVDSACRQS